MNLVQKIRESLEDCPEALLVHTEKHLFLSRNYLDMLHSDIIDPACNGFFWLGTAQEVSFRVAPKNGLYDAEELQQFMLRLVPQDLEPTRINNFTLDYFRKKPDSMRMGKLYFDEIVGEEKLRRELTITDQDVLNAIEQTELTREKSRPLKRRIIVELFPCEAYINDLLKGPITINDNGRSGSYDIDIANARTEISLEFLKRRYQPAQPRNLFQRVAAYLHG